MVGGGKRYPGRLLKANNQTKIMETSSSPKANRIGPYADILLDDWFKRSFKEYGNAKRLMQLFIEALIPERKIKQLEYTPEESTNQNPDKKSIRVDVECTDENGERFVVEVQRASQSDFYDRAVFNSTFSIQRQLNEGSDIYGFKPVYLIGIMRFTLHPDDNSFLFTYSLREDGSGQLMTDDLHYVFLEVTKCRDHKNASLVEKIGYALANMGSFEKRPEGFVGEFFDLLFSSADLATFAPEEKLKYENNMTTERDIRNQIAYAREEGREEERLTVARKLKERGISPAVIAEATGLSAEQIEAL